MSELKDLANRPAKYRASDADREAVAELLRQHATDGRLTMEEFGQRIDECLTATTYGQLRRSLRELPLPAPAPARPAVRLAKPTVDLARPPRRGGRALAVMLAAMVVVGLGSALSGHHLSFVPLVPLLVLLLLGPARRAGR